MTEPLVAGLLAGLLLVTFARGAAGSSAQAVPAQGYPSAEAAIAADLAARGVPYAGPCDRTRSPEHLGQRCTRFAEERAGLAAYLAGRTFGEFDRWLFVERRPSGWVVAASAPLDFHDTTGRVPWPR